MRYELLEHTADVMIRAKGRSLAECFANAAYALFDQIVDVEKVEERREYSFNVEGFDLESLLMNFLSEFLYIHDTTRLVFCRFDVRIEGVALTCTAWGEEIDVERHRAKREIKAVTYHMMKIDEKEPSVQVLFDI
ncbi:MAG: archease [Methanomassiliicoccales archaeon]|nr:MAG: archease [Methanomassiliicoccales archaeon]